MAKEPGKKHPGGAPTKYNPNVHPLLAFYLAKDGKTDQEVADLFGVHLDTLFEWKKVHPEFSETNARGKNDPDDAVEKTLYQRAIGGFTIKKTVKDADGETVRTMEEEVPPDVTAALKWLFNRRPDRWREKREVALTGPDGGMPIFQVVFQKPDEPKA